MAEGASKSGSVVRVAAWHDGQLTDTEGLPAVAEATPKAPRPSASTAAVERGVTVNPKPSPNSPRVAATSPTRTPGDQRDIASRAVTLASTPATEIRRSDMIRTRKPDASAPTAVAPASEPSASRWSFGPPYKTRSTNTAPPMIAVAKP